MNEIDVGVSVSHGVPRELVNEFLVSPVIRDARTKGEIRTLEESVYAGVEFLLPAGVVLFVSSQYVAKLAALAAADHYPLFKAAVNRLFERVERIHAPRLGTPKGKLGADPLGQFCIVVRFDSGRVLRFRFPSDRAAAAAGLEAFWALMESIGFEKVEHVYRAALRESSGGSTLTLFDPDVGAWYLVAPETERPRWLGR